MARNSILGNLILCLGVATATFGCATAPSPSVADSRAGNLKSAASPDSHCVVDTASRIKRPADKACSATPGTSYSQQELESTGRIDTSDALKQLDPRIQ
jgi:hypothetical protein